MSLTEVVWTAASKMGPVTLTGASGCPCDVNILREGISSKSLSGTVCAPATITQYSTEESALHCSSPGAALRQQGNASFNGSPESGTRQPSYRRPAGGAVTLQQRR
ncbi:hypothetical protein KIL84_004047 [Mauremys mutica]|uniref:Uncharacterized protein n=1 Tax=Mauremys mutica TaxID=74926 RepID=A0A9D3XNX9_9SAUR|nr:hypothetical protein KIL84_004047 [Mauremys mutica]